MDNIAKLARPGYRQRKLEGKSSVTCCWCGKVWLVERIIILTNGYPGYGYYYKTQATIEHLKPKFEGGTNAQENLDFACLKCNNSRHAKPKMSKSGIVWNKKDQLELEKNWQLQRSNNGLPIQGVTDEISRNHSHRTLGM
jgi:5-methylcytosine-specific restriction endonuclease McrA